MRPVKPFGVGSHGCGGRGPMQIQLSSVAEKLVSIVDSKYKKAAGAYENHDFYQVISYATGLACRGHT